LKLHQSFIYPNGTYKKNKREIQQHMMNNQWSRLRQLALIPHRSTTRVSRINAAHHYQQLRYFSNDPFILKEESQTTTPPPTTTTTTNSTTPTTTPSTDSTTSSTTKSRLLYSKEIARDIVSYIDERTRVRGFSTLKILSGIAAISIFLWTFFHDEIKDRLSEHTADVAGRSLTSDAVQVSAQQLSKSVLNDVLADPEMRQAALLFVVDLLQREETRDAAKTLVLQLFQDPTVNAELAKLILAQWGTLMADEYAKQQVTGLAYYVISQPSTMEAAQTQAINIVQSESLQNNVNNLFYNSLRSDVVREGANDLARVALDGMLSSEEVNNKVRDWVNSILGDETLRMRGGEALWGVTKWAVLPRWISGTPAPPATPPTTPDDSLVSHVKVAASELQHQQPHLPLEDSYHPSLSASAIPDEHTDAVVVHSDK
jgi:hypothetical protein